MTLLWIALVLARFYWPVSVEQLASGTVKHTHVQVTGRVAYTRIEEDGDLHIKLWPLADSADFIIAECIPALPCARPRAGAMVTVQGISRRDPEHGWYEVHPVERIVP